MLPKHIRQADSHFKKLGDKFAKEEARLAKLEVSKASKKNSRYSSVILSAIDMKWDKLKINLVEPIIHALTYHIARCYGWVERFDFRLTSHGVHSEVVEYMLPKLNNADVLLLKKMSLPELLNGALLRIMPGKARKITRENYFIEQGTFRFYEEMVKEKGFLDILFEYLSSLTGSEIVFSSYVGFAQTEMISIFRFAEKGISRKPRRVRRRKSIKKNILDAMFFERGLQILNEIEKLKCAYKNVANISAGSEAY